MRLSDGERGALRFAEGEGEGVDVGLGNDRTTANTSSTAFLHSSSTCSIPHQFNDTITRRKPLAPTFERPDQSIAGEGKLNAPSALVERPEG